MPPPLVETSLATKIFLNHLVVAGLCIYWLMRFSSLRLRGEPATRVQERVNLLSPFPWFGVPSLH